MSDLIDHLRNSAEIRSNVRQELRRPREVYNTLYWNGDIDFRLCGKNACSTVKVMYRYLHIGGIDHLKDNWNLYSVGTAKRKEIYEGLVRSGVEFEDNYFKFRKGSRKVAIVRDPVDRALSGVKYCYKYELNNQQPTYKQIVDTLDNLEILDNKHFFSQYWNMGKYDEYDVVYPIDDLDKLAEKLFKIYGKSDVLKTYPFKKVNTSKSTITADDLPERTVKRLKRLYEMDYENGWYI